MEISLASLIKTNTPETTPRTPQEFQQVIAPTWEMLLSVLASPILCPVPQVNTACQMAWKMVGSLVTPLIGNEGVSSLSFAVIGPVSKPAGCIFVPFNYCDLVREDPWMQLGAVASISGQVCAFWDLLCADTKNMQAQARNLELQLLEWARDSQPDFAPNKYQTKLFSYSGEERPKIEPTPYCFKRANEKFSSFIRVPFREPTPIEESSEASKRFFRGS